MYVDSSKTIAEIEADIKAQKKAQKQKRVANPTRMVVEEEDTKKQENSFNEYNHTYGLQDLYETKGQAEGMNVGVSYSTVYNPSFNDESMEDVSKLFHNPIDTPDEE